MEHVSLNVENHIGVVTINRPPVNSLTIQCYKEIMGTFKSIDNMDDIWVVVLRAEGKYFSTGNDVKEFRMVTSVDSTVENDQMVRNDCICAVYECRVPVIGAIQGMALGTGMILASCCDILIASENAVFGIPEIKIGLVGAACFISRVLPQQLHRYMAYSGDILTAEQMKHFGSVLKVVPEDQLLASAMKISAHLASQPPLALRGFKVAINRNENAQLKEKYGLEFSYAKEVVMTEDFKEAQSAFFEKRQPVFKGK